MSPNSTGHGPHDAVIVAARRTAIGRSHRGSLVDVDAFALARTAIQGVELGLHHVPGLAVNRHCAAGLGALQIAAASIRSGMDRASPSHTATATAPSFDMSITVWASVGVQPERTGLAPTLAIPEVLRRVGLTTTDIDSWEINEAFCSVAVASTRSLGLDPAIVNENGSGCGLGHPVAATGARMVVELL